MPTKATGRLLEALGYKSLYPPQVKALEAGVEKGVNLVVAAPTASGKTLIGLIAIVNRLAETGGRAFYTTPLRSVALEKHREFKVLEPLGYSVGISIGDYEVSSVRGDVVVTTYEKLDSILRNEPSTIESINVLVVDELHYVGDPERGPVLESLIAKILAARGGLQVVALSATIPNAEELAEWLNAKLIVDSWRPVPLYEGVYWKGEIRYHDGSSRKIPEVVGFPDVDLAIDCSREGGQSLVFSQSRRRVVNLAHRASSFSHKLNFDDKIAREAAGELMDSGGPRILREELSNLVSRGVAYHHAGLSNEQRIIIEDAFRRKGLAVIYATPTLAAGVNLPARRVIVDDVLRYEGGIMRPIGVYEYKQLAGRAGRPGLDPYGEAIIISSSSEDIEDLVETYIEGDIERVESSLGGLRGLRHMILGLIASGFAVDLKNITRVMERTLYSMQNSVASLRSQVSRAIRDLIEWGLIEGSGNEYKATLLGFEVSRNYLDPETAPKARAIMGRLRGYGDVELSLLVASMPDMTTLPVPKREESDLIERILDEAPKLVDSIDWMDPKEVRAVKIALIIYDWINEVSEDELLQRYNVGPGDIAMIVDNAEWIASGLSNVIQVLGFSREISSNLKILAKRIRHGIKPELIPLVAIPKIGRVRARRLYEAGYKAIHELALASPQDLLKIPGIGPGIVREILEYLGRKEEALKISKSEGKGLDAYM